MNWIEAIHLAFSVFSGIPMPAASNAAVFRDERTIRLSLAFLPLVGTVIGVSVCVWQMLCEFLNIGAVLFSAVAVVLPALITGGIHMDGFCDTQDALASWKDTKSALKILKDPRVGAFASTRMSMYTIVSFAVLHELFTRGHSAEIGCVYTLSRCAAAWSAAVMPPARSDGMLKAFAGAAVTRTDTRTVLAILAAQGAVCSFIWFRASSYPAGFFCSLSLMIPLSLWYRRMTRIRFGGVTGDTTGFYLQLAELAMLSGQLIGVILKLRITDYGL